MKQFAFSRHFATTILAQILVAAIFAAPAVVFAQEEAADETNMEILRDKLKADKKLVVASNMSLTDAEAKAFWPLYDEYQKELQALNARLKNTVASYAEAYNANTLTDEGAKKLGEEVTAIDEAELKMRRAYATKLNAVLPGKKAVRYLQIETKIRAVLRYELAAGIPLVE
ncbi:MAG: hypothetical protein ACREOO_26215 [bacterium]